MGALESVIEELFQRLQPWRTFLIVIDGRDGVGKSPLGRRLSWELQVPLIETDLYLKETEIALPEYHIHELSRVINKRLTNNRPVIVEGIFVRRLARELGFIPDYTVHVTCPEVEGSHKWQEHFLAYEAEFTPSSANRNIVWPS